MKPFLTIIIPCYNEKENLDRGVLQEVNDYMKKQKFSWEVIVSDDGSSDGSIGLVEKQIMNWKNFRQLKNLHGGKPSALMYGIKASEGKYVLFTDTDQSTPINQLKKLMPYSDKNYGAIIGSRGMNRKNFPWYRRLGAIVFMSFRKLFILSELNDTQCGFKLFESKVLKISFPKIDFFRNKKDVKGWKVTSYDVELLHIIKKMGGNIKEIRVIWNDEDISTSKGGAFSKYVKESKSMILQILRVKINDLKGAYDQ